MKKVWIAYHCWHDHHCPEASSHWASPHRPQVPLSHQRCSTTRERLGLGWKWLGSKGRDRRGFREQAAFLGDCLSVLSPPQPLVDLLGGYLMNLQSCLLPVSSGGLSSYLEDTLA